MKKVVIASLILIIALAGCSSKNENKTSEKESEVSSEKMVKTFLEHSYSDNDIKQWNDFEEYASKQLKKSVENQKQTFDDNGVTKETEDITIYKSTDNDKEYMFNIKVKTTDDNAKNIDYNQRYGIVKLKNENGHIKINNLKEVGSETYNGGD